ncbi:hypothetical protein TrRE_jg12206, partial [Triparma retinervis]
TDSSKEKKIGARKEKAKKVKKKKGINKRDNQGQKTKIILDSGAATTVTNIGDLEEDTVRQSNIILKGFNGSRCENTVTGTLRSTFNTTDGGHIEIDLPAMATDQTTGEQMKHQLVSEREFIEATDAVVMATKQTKMAILPEGETILFNPTDSSHPHDNKWTHEEKQTELERIKKRMGIGVREHHKQRGRENQILQVRDVTGKTEMLQGEVERLKGKLGIGSTTEEQEEERNATEVWQIQEETRETSICSHLPPSLRHRLRRSEFVSKHEEVMEQIRKTNEGTTQVPGEKEEDGKRTYAAVVEDMSKRKEIAIVKTPRKQPQTTTSHHTNSNTGPTTSNPTCQPSERKGRNRTVEEGWTTIRRHRKETQHEDTLEGEGEENDTVRPLFEDIQHQDSEDEDTEDEELLENLHKLVYGLGEKIRKWAVAEAYAEYAENLEEKEGFPRQEHTTLGELRTVNDWVAETRIRINNLTGGDGKRQLKEEMKKVEETYSVLLQKAKKRSNYERHANARQVKRKVMKKKERELQKKKDDKAVKQQEEEQQAIKEGIKELQDIAEGNQRVEPNVALLSNKFAGADVTAHQKDEEGNIMFTLELLEKLEEVPFF